MKQRISLGARLGVGRGHLCSRPRPGFTLLEMMVAMVLLAFALVIFEVTFPGAIQVIYKSRHMDDASIACQHQLESYRAAGYGSVSPLIGAGQSTGSGPSFTPADLPAATGTVTFTRIDTNFTATTSDTGFIRMDVTSTWTGSGVDKGSVTLTSLVVQ